MLLLLPLVVGQVAVLGSAGRSCAELRGEAGVAAHSAQRWASGRLLLVLS